jgi:transcriptional regulator with GAF, ATPase, and Fis domain
VSGQLRDAVNLRVARVELRTDFLVVRHDRFEVDVSEPYDTRAEVLGLKPSTLHSRMQKLGIQRPV